MFKLFKVAPWLFMTYFAWEKWGSNLGTFDFSGISEFISNLHITKASYRVVVLHVMPISCILGLIFCCRKGDRYLSNKEEIPVPTTVGLIGTTLGTIITAIMYGHWLYQ